jgi:hypothetical protein
MIELKGVESDREERQEGGARVQYIISADEQAELKPGDEFLLLVTKPPDLKHEEYGIPLRVSNNREPDEGEFIVQYGDRLFVAQKIPEFI